MSTRIATFLDDYAPASPCLVVDLNIVADRYHSLCDAFPNVSIFYAVKANPEPDLIAMLARLGASFDVASPGEIDVCLKAGAAPESLSYGNTIKKQNDIAYAQALGVNLFAFDSAGELDKIAKFAPGSSVFCRILIGSEGARWPLSDKFGCTPNMAVDLLRRASTLAVEPAGVSFHVGSQQTVPRRWNDGIRLAAEVFAKLQGFGIRPRMLNLGGGLPASYLERTPPLRVYSHAIQRALKRYFPDGETPAIVMEPGRSIAGDAGILRTNVVLVSRKSYGAKKRWVYLDAGRYGGLAETEGEAIRYRLSTERDGGPVGPVILAGPTCDSTDVLYKDTVYSLPLALDVGDHVNLLSAGAYTTSYASEFNGFEPLRAYCIGDPS